MWPFGYRSRYPYTDFHELNLDWILGKITELDHAVKNWLQNVTPTIRDTVNQWLDDHPEATTTVEDGAITFQKLSDLLTGNHVPYTMPYINQSGDNIHWTKECLIPQMFGAAADGVTDDSASVTAMITAANEYDLIYFPAGTYYLAAPVNITKNINIINAGILKTDIENPFIILNGLSSCYLDLGQMEKGNKTFNYTEQNTSYSIAVLSNALEYCTVKSSYVKNFTTALVIYADNVGVHYNTFDFGRCDTFDVIDLFTLNDGWINGNNFNGFIWEIHSWYGNTNLVPQTMIKNRASRMNGSTPYKSNGNMFMHFKAECGSGINASFAQHLIDCEYSRGYKFMFDRVEIQGGLGTIDDIFTFTNSNYNAVYLAVILNPFTSSLGASADVNRIIRLENIAEIGYQDITDEVTLKKTTMDQYYFHVEKDLNTKTVHIYGTLKTTEEVSGARILDDLPTCAAGQSVNAHVSVSDSATIWTNGNWTGNILSITGGDSYAWIVGTIPANNTIYIDMSYHYAN